MRSVGGDVKLFFPNSFLELLPTYVGYQAAPLATTWNTNPSTIIPTATAAIGSRTSAVAFAPFTGPVKVSKSPLPNRQN